MSVEGKEEKNGWRWMAPFIQTHGIFRKVKCDIAAIIFRKPAERRSLIFMLGNEPQAEILVAVGSQRMKQSRP